jgi:PhnB protein
LKNVCPFVAVDHCKEALERYRAIFGGEVRVLMGQNDRVLQAELRLGDSMIHFADAAMAKPSSKGDQVKVMVEFESEEALRKSYENLSADGQILVPLHQTNFGAMLANVADWNGVGWILKYVRT